MKKRLKEKRKKTNKKKKKQRKRKNERRKKKQDKKDEQIEREKKYGKIMSETFESFDAEIKGNSPPKCKNCHGNGRIWS